MISDFVISLRPVCEGINVTELKTFHLHLIKQHTMIIIKSHQDKIIDKSKFALDKAFSDIDKSFSVVRHCNGLKRIERRIVA